MDVIDGIVTLLAKSQKQTLAILPAQRRGLPQHRLKPRKEQKSKTPPFCPAHPTSMLTQK
jgi:hypothetical protein